MELDKIIELVNKHFDVDIMQKSQKRNIVMARASYYWIAQKSTKKSLSKIGLKVNKNHATVIHSIKNFEDWLNFDKEFKEKFEVLRKKIFENITVKDLIIKKIKYKHKLIKIAKEFLTIELTKLKQKQNGKY